MSTVKKCDKFYCTKELLREDDKTLFTADKTYECLSDGVLIDDNGEETVFEKDDSNYLELFNNHFINTNDM